MKIANVINKAGIAVQPSVSSAQAAVRASSSTMLRNSTCLGFGICGDLLDSGDEDVWPLTAITVRLQRTVACHASHGNKSLTFPAHQNIHVGPRQAGVSCDGSRHGGTAAQYMLVPLRGGAGTTCGQMRGVYDYVAWILACGAAVQEIATRLQWAVMPLQIAQEALAILNGMTCLDGSLPRPTGHRTLGGGGGTRRAPRGRGERKDPRSVADCNPATAPFLCMQAAFWRRA